MNKNIVRYVHSSVVTFLAVFLPILLVELQSRTFDDLWQTGWVALLAVLARLAVKAIYETVIILLPKIIKKVQ